MGTKYPIYWLWAGLLTGFAIGFLVGLNFNEPTTKSARPIAGSFVPRMDSETVYVGKSGDCFHAYGKCLRGIAQSMTKEHAEARGYRPCSRCFR